ncbi:uncharacterized protein MYCFIDRAFT_171444 [Pseudocercospora fijiensis CIRAD86]|uniref:Uncharacterized protein n=1 Tax=Pseudocercospora fijiensis (strain CIRAD86) TaxID=383855 RepID=M3A348_PSEFD|nr:uncharacterized protein MYCFIDRAFT_171444 [Pseudocercospora fijiensis CIRAD86]EME85529.1 hypothetical protein MYCFIDRAFT_171444 [Pseudocercospora fijiensis CIRAD86]
MERAAKRGACIGNAGAHDFSIIGRRVGMEGDGMISLSESIGVYQSLGKGRNDTSCTNERKKGWMTLALISQVLKHSRDYLTKANTECGTLADVLDKTILDVGAYSI